jgi:hypothetical protein
MQILEKYSNLQNKLEFFSILFYNKLIMSVKDRLKKFVKYSNLTVKAFEISINVSNGYVNNMSKSIGIDKLELVLEKYSNLNLEWLITGKGEMIKSTGLNAAAEQTEIFEKSAPAIKLDTKDELIMMQKKEINRLEKEISRLEIELADCLEQKKHTKVIK